MWERKFCKNNSDVPYGSVQNRADVRPVFETKQVSGGEIGENYRVSKDGETSSRMEAV